MRALPFQLKKIVFLRKFMLIIKPGKLIDFFRKITFYHTLSLLLFKKNFFLPYYVRDLNLLERYSLEISSRLQKAKQKTTTSRLHATYLLTLNFQTYLNNLLKRLSIASMPVKLLERCCGTVLQHWLFLQEIS